MRLHSRRFVFCVLTCIAAFLAVSARGVGAEPDGKDAEYYELMKRFADTFEQIDRNYVKDVDRQKLVEAAIRGMVKELDQYSNYISPEDLARFQQQVDQQFGGIGIQVRSDPKTTHLQVISPLPGTPAYRAGIKAGDLIVDIKGQSTKGMTLDEAVKILKGKPGDEVTIGIRHAGETETEPVTLKRAIIKVSTVLGDRYGEGDHWNYMYDRDKKIAYIRLTHFSRRTADELKAALDKLMDKGMQGLVLDLRFNPGGLLSQATEIADMFIDDGLIVSTKGRNSPERSWHAKKDGTYSGFPMAVLINRYSASASEIVSACLKDHDRAVIVGERTWGKGSVQNVIDLEAGAGGQGALKLTTASYHRPNGKNIHKFEGATDEDEWGVLPSEGHRLRFTDEQMQAYLEYRQKKDVLGGEAVEQFEDTQLQDALKYIAETLEGKGKTASEKKRSDADKKAAKVPAPPEPAEGAAVPRRIRVLRSTAA